MACLHHSPFGGTSGAVGCANLPIRVVLAEDSVVIRDVLAQILNASPDIDLVAGDAPALLLAIEETRPDVVVTDIRMPPTGTDEGLRISERLAAAQPDLGVVLVTQYSDPEWLSQVFGGGSENRGWVMKELVHSNGQLISAIKAVHLGQRWVDPSVMPPE